MTEDVIHAHGHHIVSHAAIVSYRVGHLDLCAHAVDSDHDFTGTGVASFCEIDQSTKSSDLNSFSDTREIKMWYLTRSREKSGLDQVFDALDEGISLRHVDARITVGYRSGGWPTAEMKRLSK